MSIFRSLMAQSRQSNQPFGSYITDGLVFMIDAIWNDAIGQPQKPSLGGIRDLVSGTVIPFPVAYKFLYHDNGLTMLSGNKTTTHRAEFNTGLSLDTFSGMTIEQVDKPIEWQFTDSFSTVQATVTNSIFAFASRRPDGSSVDHDAIRSYYMASQDTIYSAMLHKPAVMNTNRHMSCAMSPVIAQSAITTFPTNISSLRINGAPVTQMSDRYAVRASISSSSPLMVYIGNNSRMDMEFYSYRIYNRPLSPEEQAHNYAIDRARFGI